MGHGDLDTSRIDPWFDGDRDRFDRIIRHGMKHLRLPGNRGVDVEIARRKVGNGELPRRTGDAAAISLVGRSVCFVDVDRSGCIGTAGLIHDGARNGTAFLQSEMESGLFLARGQLDSSHIRRIRRPGIILPDITRYARIEGEFAWRKIIKSVVPRGQQGGGIAVGGVGIIVTGVDRS